MDKAESKEQSACAAPDRTPPDLPLRRPSPRLHLMRKHSDIRNAAVVGGGLAGCECALRLAGAGIAVTLFEQKPQNMSPAHTMTELAELVCSNSLRSDEIASGVGLLKQEMRELGSVFMSVAQECAVPAGKALAVDRELFARRMTRAVEAHPAITLTRREIGGLDDPALEGFAAVVVAAGPLASDALSRSLAQAVGSGHLYFYDAIAPIVTAESVDMSAAFRASRYQDPDDAQTPGDYVNCPMDKERYLDFHAALLSAERVAARDFEKEIHFEGCMPIEALAERGERTLTFGPFKPTGLTDPRTGRRPWAVVQLRAENRNASMYNLVGCQTKLTYKAQAEVFRRIPGLERAEFARFGSMHRNTYVNAPLALTPDLRLKGRDNVWLAGQLTGVEGYVESAACGLWAGMLLAARLNGRDLPPPPPPETALGALLLHLRTPAKRFQPSNVHFGLMPELPERAKKKDRKALYSQRAREAFETWRRQLEHFNLEML